MCYNSVIGVGKVTIEGECVDQSIQQVQINHLVGGRAVHLDVIPVSRGRFSIPIQLYRGHNEIICSPFDASERTFSIKVIFKGAMREWLETFICSVMFALIIKTFVVQPFYIPSESMEDTLKRGDRIMVSRFDYLLRSPARKDVIVFEYPKTKRRYFVKRIIGLPNEKLEVIERQVYVDGRLLRENYLKKVDEKYKGISSLDSLNDLRKVRPHNYFVMGDNRDMSEDSRSWGTVPNHKLVGRAAFIWYPWSRMRWLQ